MILFQLKCGCGHSFEAWFRDGASYEAQATRGEISCPLCGDAAVGKAPMAPRLVRNVGDGTERAARMVDDVGRALVELRRQVEDKCDYVGERFPEEARRIHYGEDDARPIYGEATAEEARELEEEGVAVARIPWVPLDS